MFIYFISDLRIGNDFKARVFLVIWVAAFGGLTFFCTTSDVPGLRAKL